MRLLCIIITLISASAFAVDWEAKFRDTCRIDDFCQRLKESDGTWLKPKPEIVALLKNPDIQQQIKNTAEKYGVSPVAIAGSILAENSLNVGVKDRVQNLLAGKLGITSVAGKQFTVGLGQINLMTAIEADQHMAKIEGRPAKTPEELRKEILDPEGSIRVVGTILRQVQDDYKEQGFDISKDPAVLTTVYNLGKSKEKAKAAKEAGRQPRANYFGLFVDKYSEDINKYIGPASSKTVAVKVTSAPAVTAPKTSKAGADSSPAVKPEKPSKKLEKIETVSSSVPLVTHPLDCQDSRNGQDNLSQAKTMAYGAPSGILEKNQGFTEVSRGFDCKSNVWKLVKSETGVAGWVPEETLNQVKSVKYEEPTKCGAAAGGADCLAKIKKSSPDMISSEDPKSGVVFLKPVTAPNAKEASFQNEDVTCGYQIPETEEKGSRKNPGFYGIIEAPKLPATAMEANAKQALAYAETALSNIQKATGVSVQNLDGPENPYSMSAAILQMAKVEAKKCIQSLQTEMVTCRDYTDALKELKAASEYKFAKNPSVADVIKVGQELPLQQAINGGGYPQSNYAPLINGKSPYSASEIKDSIKACKERIVKIAAVPSTQQALQTAAAMSGGGIGMVGGGMGMPAGLTPYQADFFQGVENSPDDKINTHGEDLSRIVDYCHARLNLLSTEGVSQKYTCIQAKSYVMHNYQTFARNLVADAYKKKPELVIQDLNTSWNRMVPSELHQAFTSGKKDEDENSSSRNSYCPNKTAEFISDLLAQNNCIERVYMPSKLLVKKLGDSKSKVIFREFEKDGVYAVEFKGAGQCKAK